MKSKLLPQALASIILVMGCSSGQSDAASTTTLTTDTLTESSLLSRIDDSVSVYIERAVLERPQLLSRITKEDLLACAAATSKDIAKSIYLNRTGQASATTSGTDSGVLTEMVINEASAAVQSQLEPILARCTQGS